MTVKFEQASLWSAIRRGLVGRCPRCGEGRLFSAYLKVVPTCPNCALQLTPYRADDGPAYFTILIVGHLVIAPMLFTNIVLTWSLPLLLGLLLPTVVGVSLFLLPRVKGAFVAVQWAVGDRAVV